MADTRSNADSERPSPEAESCATEKLAPGAPAFRHLVANRARFLEAVRSGRFYRLVWVKFKIIDGCNIRCAMCNHWRRDGYKRSALSRQRLMELAPELAELGTRRVHWSGGEPTIRQDLPEVIGRFRRFGMVSSMTSNGTRLTPDYARRLCTAGLGRAILSLESADAEVHDRLVGVEGAWQKLVTGAQHLKRDVSLAPQIIFQTVLTSLNVGPALVDLVSIAAEVGAERIKFQPVMVDHLMQTDRRLLPSAEQIHRFRTGYLPEMIERGNRLGVEVKVDGDAAKAGAGGRSEEADEATYLSALGDHALGHYEDQEHTCYLPWYHCTVDYRGNVYACCHMRNGDGLLGNLEDTSLIDVLQSHVARTLRRRLSGTDVPDPCRECTMQIGENRDIDRALAEEPLYSIG